jgi:hypothetical protein
MLEKRIYFTFQKEKEKAQKKLKKRVQQLLLELKHLNLEKLKEI